MRDHRTGEILPKRIQGKGFVVLENGLDKTLVYHRVMTYKIVVYSTKNCYLIENGDFSFTNYAKELIKKNTLCKCFINTGTGEATITNQDVPAKTSSYTTPEGKVIIIKRRVKRSQKTIYRRTKKVTKLSPEEAASIVVEELL